VQRYLTGGSVRESQLGMIFNGLLKVPLQFFILLVGVMVFVFYQFHTAPLNFNPAATQTVLNSQYANQYEDLMVEHENTQEQKQRISLNYAENKETMSDQEIASFQKEFKRLSEKEEMLKEDARTFIDAAEGGAESNDKDYVFIHFILNNLPKGVVGLLIAVILSAAMSSTASELNALASTTTIDIYRRNIRKDESEEHYLEASKWFTLMWGVIAIAFASLADLFDNLIQLVNIIGSIFYGNVLGIFLLAFFMKKIKSNAVFIAAIITQALVILVFNLNLMPYLWLNVLGCILVISISWIIQISNNAKNKTETTV